jgi:hypothetical protein
VAAEAAVRQELDLELQVVQVVEAMLLVLQVVLALQVKVLMEEQVDLTHPLIQVAVAVVLVVLVEAPQTQLKLVEAE